MTDIEPAAEGAAQAVPTVAASAAAAGGGAGDAASASTSTSTSAGSSAITSAASTGASASAPPARSKGWTTRVAPGVTFQWLRSFAVREDVVLSIDDLWAAVGPRTADRPIEDALALLKPHLAALL